ncbi:MAG: response regulator, partial [Desulfobulbaceae bacterium]|nr:response regulator [Desulfobulbaceae bacterium]HIJ79965.1 response regulator [Deltaproteobacteria bacterium]
YINGSLSGYLELGEEISHITGQMKETLGIEILSVIDKKFLNRAKWEEGMGMIGVSANWDLFDDFVVSEQTLSHIPRKLIEALGEHQQDHSLRLFDALIDGRVYSAGIVPLRDVSGQEVGEFVVLQDFEHKKSLMQRLSLTQGITFIVFGSVLYLFFWMYLTRVQKLLLSSRRELEDEIAERKISQRACQVSEERYRDLFEHAHDLIMIVHPDGRILYVNRSWCETLGFADYEISELKLADIVVHSDVQAFLETFNKVITVGEAKDIRASFVSKLGKKISVAGSATCKYENQAPVSVRCILRDVTEQEELKEQLYQSQKIQAIGTLAGGIAHDFNNILTAILGYSEFLKKDIVEGSEGWFSLQEVIKAGRRAKELVKQILTFSRQAKYELQPVQLNLVVNEALGLVRSSIPTTVAIRSAISSSCGVIMADPTQMHQVIMNLCTNGYQAMKQDSDGELTVSLESVEIKAGDYLVGEGLAPGIYLKLRVADTGCGMEPAVMSRIFEPYFSTKEQGDGAGLGLSVVHGIVERHHGHIAVESVPGEGSTFTIYFPQVDTQRPIVIPEYEAPIQRGDERVMVVDDERAVAQLERMALEGLGYQVQSFTVSEEALEVFRNKPDKFDLIITDMAMPNMTGAELARKLIAIRPDIPIILCTGFSETINEVQAKALGIEEYIMKPVIEKDIAIAVRKVLDRRKKKGR